jgi:arginase
VSAARIVDLPQPVYSPNVQPATRILNGPQLRQFNLALADVVEEIIRADEFPLVVGGDCSILLGALAAVRRHFGAVGLVHIDGHSDFRHPGNYPEDMTVSAAAGMDLALATGRGEPLLTRWPGVSGSLISDKHAVQIGEREARDDDFAWPDVNDTAIHRIDIFEAQGKTGAELAASALSAFTPHDDLPFWVLFDVDVLDQIFMPAVDSPGSPGLDPQTAADLLRILVSNPKCLGLTLTVFDPDLDRDGRYATLIVNMLRSAFASASVQI